METKKHAEFHHVPGFAEALLAFLNGGEPVKIVRLGEGQPVNEEQMLE